MRKVLKFIFNINILIAIILSFLINNYIKILTGLNGTNMFIALTGLITVIVFTYNFLSKQTEQLQNSYFYLGYSEEGINYFDNFWFKKFKNVPVNIFLYFMLITSVINIIDDKLKIIDRNILNYINSLWIVIFVIIVFYFSIILIESLSIAKSLFYDCERIKVYNRNKSKIQNKIAEKSNKQYRMLFRMFLNKKIESNLFLDLLAIKKVLRIEKDEEFKKYYKIIFDAEKEEIKIIMCKICSLQRKNNNSKCKSLVIYRNWKIKRYINKIYEYYLKKWDFYNYDYEKIHQEFTLFLHMALRDLENIIYIEDQIGIIAKDEYNEKICSNNLEDIVNDIYFILSRQNYKSYINAFISESSDTQIDEKKYYNKIIFIILANIEKFIPFNFPLEDLCGNIEQIIDIIKIIYKKEDEYIFKNNTYLKNYLDIPKYIYEICISEFHDKGNKLFEKFNIAFKNEIFIKERYKTDIFKLLLNTADYINLNYYNVLLPVLDINQRIIVFIFRLAKLDRSKTKHMSLNEFNIWYKYISHNYDKLCKVKENNQFVEELCAEARKKENRISHYMSDDLLKAIWNSCMKKFDFQQYKQCENKETFSFNSYILLRVILSARVEMQLEDKIRNRINEDTKLVLDKYGYDIFYI